MTRKTEVSGREIYLLEAKYCEESSMPLETVKLGMLVSDLRKYAERGENTMISQFIKLVPDGLENPTHIYKGLERPLYCDENENGDDKKLIYCYEPSVDYEWRGDRFNGEELQYSPPENCLFVIYVSINDKHDDQFPDVKGWIEHWTWVEIDQDHPTNKTPIGSDTRYGCKLL